MRTRLTGRAVLAILAGASARADDKPRARELGVPFDGKPGPFDAITDVSDVEVGSRL